MKLTSFIYKNRLFLGGYLALLILIGILCIVVPKGAENIWMDLNRNFVGDVFFANYTNVGDGAAAIILCLLLASVKSFKKAIQAALIFSISGLAAQVVKKFIAGPVPRPSLFLENTYKIQGAEGVELLTNFSFPSGHTTTFFALCCFFALWLHNRFSLLWLIPAALGAISRMYLGQHFLIDVFAGACLGGFTTIIVYYSSEQWHWLNHPNLKRSLLRK